MVHEAGRRRPHVQLISDLARVQCPTLVMGGEEDPMTPIECQADIAAALTPHLVRFERFAACGHTVVSKSEGRFGKQDFVYLADEDPDPTSIRKRAVL